MGKIKITKERNVQIVLAILKAHNIRKIVVSPGSTNIAVVGSLQNDPFFEMYSSVDERSAAYMACGLSLESGEPVVLSCTGATASRNYYPGLTEAYYRKLPILALTSSQDSRLIGQLKVQVTDRSCPPRDVVNMSVCLQNIRDAKDEQDVTIKANRAVLELFHHGGGPVHVNIETTYSRDFVEQDVDQVRIIHRYNCESTLPVMPSGKIGVFIGSHRHFSDETIEAIDTFCATHEAIVLCEPTSNYTGKFGVMYGLPMYQIMKDNTLLFELGIHLGEMSEFVGVLGCSKEVWRISEDGELRDPLGLLTNVFEMSEKFFFNYYQSSDKTEKNTLVAKARTICEKVASKIPILPFSQLWCIQQIHDKFPKDSVVHLGILAPLRSWNFMAKVGDALTDSNQGGFGIDGNLSTLIGASQIHKEKLYYVIVGDLSFFYDMNSLGNRHVGKNVRILVVNNGVGCEFRLFNQMGNILSPQDINAYMSAGGHYGNQSRIVIKNYVESLGYQYISADSKDDFMKQLPCFINSEIGDKPIVFETFTNPEDDNLALQRMQFIYDGLSTKKKITKAIKGIVGENLVSTIKHIVK